MQGALGLLVSRPHRRHAPPPRRPANAAAAAGIDASTAGTMLRCAEAKLRGGAATERGGERRGPRCAAAARRQAHADLRPQRAVAVGARSVGGSVGTRLDAR
eukprot:scaffold51862_cov45-Phaeocystis_antarctica.AAC.3